MAIYYADPTATAGGDGTKEKPFRGLKEFSTFTPEKPFMLVLSGNKTESLSSTITLSLGLCGGSEIVTDNGDFYRLLVINENQSHATINAGQLSISNVCFDHWGPKENAVKVNWELLSDPITNVSDSWFYNCKFRNAPSTQSAQKNFSVMFKGWFGSDAIAHKFGVMDSQFIRVSAGVNAFGNTGTTTSTDNRGDFKRAKGVRVGRCAFIDMKSDAAILNGTASNIDQPEDLVDEWTSAIHDCMWVSTQYHAASLYTVPFWFYRANNSLILRCTAGGQKGIRADKQPFDFDEQCWGCVIKDSYSYGNYGGSILTSAWGGENTMPAGWEGGEYDWYYTRRFGGGNHKVINSGSFNDGTVRGIVQLQGFIYNMTIENSDFIRSDGDMDNYDLFNQSYLSHSQASIDANNIVVLTIKSGSIICPNYQPVVTGLQYTGGTGAHTTPVASLVKMEGVKVISKTLMTDALMGGVLVSNMKYSTEPTPFNGSEWENEKAVRAALAKLR